MAGAYAILKGRLTRPKHPVGQPITRCFVELNFLKGNINYVPTGAVALVVASKSIAM
jgi:hypothetical protein